MSRTQKPPLSVADLAKFRADVWDLRKPLFLIRGCLKTTPPSDLKRSAESAVNAVSRLFLELDKVQKRYYPDIAGTTIGGRS